MLLREVNVAYSETGRMAVVHLVEALCCRLKGRESSIPDGVIGVFH